MTTARNELIADARAWLASVRRAQAEMGTTGTEGHADAYEALLSALDEATRQVAELEQLYAVQKSEGLLAIARKERDEATQRAEKAELNQRSLSDQVEAWRQRARRVEFSLQAAEGRAEHGKAPEAIDIDWSEQLALRDARIEELERLLKLSVGGEKPDETASPLANAITYTVEMLQAFAAGNEWHEVKHCIGHIEYEVNRAIAAASAGGDHG